MWFFNFLFKRGITVAFGHCEIYENCEGMNICNIKMIYTFYRQGARGIHVAAQKGHVGVINAIIAKGENVNTMTNQKHTALHMAVEAGNPEVVECLLGNGANVHLRYDYYVSFELHNLQIYWIELEKHNWFLFFNNAKMLYPLSTDRDFLVNVYDYYWFYHIWVPIEVSLKT